MTTKSAATKSATKKSTKSAPVPKPTAATKRVRAEYDVKDAALVAKLRADIAAVAVEEAPVAVASKRAQRTERMRAAYVAKATEPKPITAAAAALNAIKNEAVVAELVAAADPKPAKAPKAEAKPVVAAEPKAPKAPKAPDALMQLCVAHIEAVHAARKDGDPAPVITTETVRDALLELDAAKVLLADKPGDKVWGALSRLRRANLIAWSWARPRVRSYAPAAR